MSKKISSASKYLGVSQKWLVTSQYYNKFYYFLTISLTNFINSLDLIRRILYSKHLHVNFDRALFSKNRLLISLNALYFNKFLENNLFNKKQSFRFYSERFQTNNFISLGVRTRLYLSKPKILSAKLIDLYLNHIQHFYPPKKLFNFILLLLKTQIKKPKIVQGNHGLMRMYMEGFKIQLKGRYEVSKSTLAKSLFFKTGQVNSNNLNGNLELLSKNIYSKLGAASIKVWFFYSKVKSNET